MAGKNNQVAYLESLKPERDEYPGQPDVYREELRLWKEMVAAAKAEAESLKSDSDDDAYAHDSEMGEMYNVNDEDDDADLSDGPHDLTRPDDEPKRRTPDGSVDSATGLELDDKTRETMKALRSTAQKSGPKDGEETPEWYDDGMDDYTSDGGKGWGADGANIVDMWGEDFGEDWNRELQKAYDAGDEKLFNDTKYAARKDRYGTGGKVSGTESAGGTRTNSDRLTDRPPRDFDYEDGSSDDGRPQQIQTRPTPYTPNVMAEKGKRNVEIGSRSRPTRDAKSGITLETVLADDDHETAERAAEGWENLKKRTSRMVKVRR